ncbi:MAG: protein kinase domain-containing protein, partial [Thermoanaerobaculia bacterium]
GRTISHYRIVGKIGDGGMGVVYKAEDVRLDRFVALKFLPPSSTTPESRKRFLHEAKAASALDHPNICTVYEIDEAEEDRLFIAMAFCEGETLREKIRRGPLKLDEAIDYAAQIASGLAAAHAKGIVHRDVKPANLLVTPDGRVKIVDFGIAKLASQTRLTQAGKMMGTLAYASPEQLRGQDVDHRTDIWSLGVILYEMVTGKFPFPDERDAVLAQAVLNGEPEPMTALRTGVPMALEWIVAKAMAKAPADRYQHADEIPIDLRGTRRSGQRLLTDRSATLVEVPLPYPNAGSPSSPSMLLGRLTLSGGKPTSKWPRFRTAALLGSLAFAALVTGWLTGWAVHRPGAVEPPSFRLLTVRRGTLRSARFASDGQTVVYGAAWDGGPPRLYLTRLDSPQANNLSLPPAELLSLSRTGELAVSLGHTQESALLGEGTLARTALLGGSPREILEHVREADWSPDGDGLAVIRRAGGQERIEFPVGKPIYTTNGYVSHIRFSPSGKLIAFLDHPVYEDDRGVVSIIDASGRKQNLSTGWFTVRGLAWSPSGDEVWFTACKAGEGLGVYAVDLHGRVRPLLRVPGSVVILDTSRDGHVLIAREDDTRHITALRNGEARERDISWLDRSHARDISRDGRFALLTHFGEGSGANYSVYLRATDGSSGVLLGEGEAMALSPDNRWAASLIHGPPSKLLLLPTGPGSVRTVPTEGIEVSGVRWFPDGRRLLLVGEEPGHKARCYVKSLTGNSNALPITPEGMGEGPWGIQLSPGGDFLAGVATDGRITLYPTGGGRPRTVSGLDSRERLLRWSADGKGLLVARRSELPLKIFRIDLETGKRELWKEISPADPAGLIPKITIHLTPDGRSYVYNSQRILSSLYIVDGLR